MELKDVPPFSLIDHTAFTHSQYEDLLKKWGVYGRGLWRTECRHHNRNRYGLLSADDTDSYVLSLETSIMKMICQEPSQPLSSWRDYYNHRGLPTNSPIAILLTYPLTLYYIITSKLTISPAHSGDDDEPLRIHVVGVEKEADLVLTFKEVSVLIPHRRLEMTMIGPHVAGRVSGATYTYNSLHVTLIKGLYHQYYTTENPSRPHLVIGFNAGLPAYVTWLDTITLLERERLPVFMTDYCRRSCEYTRDQILTHPNLNTTIDDLFPNPFCSPVPLPGTGNEEASFSNAFIYQLLWKR